VILGIVHYKHANGKVKNVFREHLRTYRELHVYF